MLVDPTLFATSIINELGITVICVTSVLAAPLRANKPLVCCPVPCQFTGLDNWKLEGILHQAALRFGKCHS